jgi:hypothetical protein
MNAQTVRAMVNIVCAMRRGEWTDELPTWADESLTAITADDPFTDGSELRAVQTAETFIILALECGYALNERAFLKACGFTA